MIVLDSDVLIEILDKNSEKTEQIIQFLQERKSEVVTTVINYHEVVFGILKRLGSKQLSPVHLLETLSVLDYTKKEALLAAQLEAELENKGKKQHRIDVMIAAIAIENKASIFTFNERHFKPIPGLRVISKRDVFKKESEMND